MVTKKSSAELLGCTPLALGTEAKVHLFAIHIHCHANHAPAAILPMNERISLCFLIKPRNTAQVDGHSLLIRTVQLVASKCGSTTRASKSESFDSLSQCGVLHAIPVCMPPHIVTVLHPTVDSDTNRTRVTADKLKDSSSQDVLNMDGKANDKLLGKVQQCSCCAVHL